VVGHTAQEVRRVGIIGAPAAVEEIAINFQPVCALYADLSCNTEGVHSCCSCSAKSYTSERRENCGARRSSGGGIPTAGKCCVVVSPQQVNPGINHLCRKRVAHVQPTTAAPKTHHVAQVEGTGIEASQEVMLV
jgi:hypothetical protein